MAGFAFDISLLYKSKLYRSAESGMQAWKIDLERASRRIDPILRVELIRHLQSTAQRVAARNSGAYPGGGPGLSRRSGAAMASLKAGVKVTSRLGSIVGEMSGVDYLMIHEYGGTIRARNSEYLTIPLPAALNAGGTPKKRSAREWNNTFIGQSKAGNMIIFQRNGRGVIPLYVLEKEVKLRARLGLRKTQAEQMDVFVAKVAMLVTKEIME